MPMKMASPHFQQKISWTLACQEILALHKRVETCSSHINKRWWSSFKHCSPQKTKMSCAFKIFQFKIIWTRKEITVVILKPLLAMCLVLYSPKLFTTHIGECLFLALNILNIIVLYQLGFNSLSCGSVYLVTMQYWSHIKYQAFALQSTKFKYWQSLNIDNLTI